MKLQLLKLYQVPIWEQLMLEEALLRNDNRNWCIMNTGSPDAIVMGISAKPNKLINKFHYHLNPVPIVKRFSGGGTVYIDPSTYFISLIFNSDGLPRFPQEIMRWTEKLYRPIFSPFGFQLLENDYLLNNRKFGGNAQYICKNRWLHHSSLLWDFCPKKMEVLHLPEKRPLYRKDRSHLDFLTTLKPCLTKEKFENLFTLQLKTEFCILKSSLKEVKGFLEKEHRRSTTLINSSDIF